MFHSEFEPLRYTAKFAPALHGHRSCLRFFSIMKWSWKLGRFAGIDTYVHASFLLLVAWYAWASWAGAGTALAVLMTVAFLVAVFASVLMHELGHALVARR